MFVLDAFSDTNSGLNNNQVDQVFVDGFQSGLGVDLLVGSLYIGYVVDRFVDAEPGFALFEEGVVAEILLENDFDALVVLDFNLKHLCEF